MARGRTPRQRRAPMGSRCTSGTPLACKGSVCRAACNQDAARQVTLLRLPACHRTCCSSSSSSSRRNNSMHGTSRRNNSGDSCCGSTGHRLSSPEVSHLQLLVSITGLSARPRLASRLPRPTLQRRSPTPTSRSAGLPRPTLRRRSPSPTSRSAGSVSDAASERPAVRGSRMAMCSQLARRGSRHSRTHQGRVAPSFPVFGCVSSSGRENVGGSGCASHFVTARRALCGCSDVARHTFYSMHVWMVPL
mmetsp:Transcript_70810/g.223681  ORF Transcript_70810/g.223681 Transcript_70810/m.223681 type:complete len:248 (+) Transcript_70810:1343-2086(+)